MTRTRKTTIVIATIVILIGSGSVVFVGRPLYQQLSRERSELRRVGAVETTSGPIYENLVVTTIICGDILIPKLYIAPKLEGYGSYMRDSISPLGLRGGEIILSRFAADNFDSQTISTLFAHELGHREQDRMLPFGTWLGGTKASFARELVAELQADYFAAGCFGFDAVTDMLETIRDLPPLTAKMADPKSIKQYYWKLTYRIDVLAEERSGTDFMKLAMR